MDNAPEFVSYKKLLIFGTEGSGKTTLSKSLEKGTFSNETHTENGKLKYYIIFLNSHNY